MGSNNRIVAITDGAFFVPAYSEQTIVPYKRNGISSQSVISTLVESNNEQEDIYVPSELVEENNVKTAQPELGIGVAKKPQ